MTYGEGAARCSFRLYVVRKGNRYIEVFRCCCGVGGEGSNLRLYNASLVDVLTGEKLAPCGRQLYFAHICARVCISVFGLCWANSGSRNFPPELSSMD